jgi:hypothetical protein
MSGQFGQLQKNVKKKISKFLFHIIHPYVEEKLWLVQCLYVRWIIWRVWFCRQWWHKNNIWWSYLNSFLKKFKNWKLAWFKLFATTFSPLGLTLFNLIFVISNVLFPFITFLFILEDLLRNENNSFLRDFYVYLIFCGFSTQFTTIK